MKGAGCETFVRLKSGQVWYVPNKFFCCSIKATNGKSLHRAGATLCDSFRWALAEKHGKEDVRCEVRQGGRDGFTIKVARRDAGLTTHIDTHDFR